MGLTVASTGSCVGELRFTVDRQPGDLVVALAGNPNVGKSTVFNALTGMKQHTGNWPGKTVTNAQGRCEWKGKPYVLVDLPGTYSLFAHSAEETVARDFLCFGGADAAVVVCDATCLERNLNLVLQALEISGNAVVCVNLMDEAKKKQICVDLEVLSKELGGVPVVGASARDGRLGPLMETLSGLRPHPPMVIHYMPAIENVLARLVPLVAALSPPVDARWLSLRLLDGDEGFFETLETYCPQLLEDEALTNAVREARETLENEGLPLEVLRDKIAAAMVITAEGVCAEAVRANCCPAAEIDRKLDRVFLSRRIGIPVMLLLLAGVLWLTISGANYPSQLLSDALFSLEPHLLSGLAFLGAPQWLTSLLVDGVYRVLAWVVSVMLPPMAIFFPCFTLLEDLGYLPRVAFNLDKYFQRAHACGKQALTMCVGFQRMPFDVRRHPC